MKCKWNDYKKIVLFDLSTYRLFVTFVNIDWVIITAFSNSFNIKFLCLAPPCSSLCFSRWCNCITEFVVTINCEIMFEQSWVVTIYKMNENLIQIHPETATINLRSALSTSMSLHGASSKLFALPRDGLPVMPGMPFIRLWSMDMLRGRGGTAGLPLFGGIDWASSELESSWPAVDKLTVKVFIFWFYYPRSYRPTAIIASHLPLLYEFDNPLRRFIIPAAVFELLYCLLVGVETPLALFCDAIVGRITPPLVAIPSGSESL